MDNTEFAKRMKFYEKLETREKFNPMKPIVVRLDGKGFSKFTKPFERPFDKDFREVMVKTAKHVMESCGGRLAYTQSDEIAIIIDGNDVFFNAKKQKLVSVIASMATSVFVVNASQIWPEHVSKTMPTFDCRIFNVPDKNEAINSVLWRQKDCVRNSISMIGHTHFSNAQMHKKSAKEVISMLRIKKDIEWNDVDTAFRYGIYVYKVKRDSYIEDSIWNNIPDKSKPESRTVYRSITEVGAFENLSFNDVKKLTYGEEDV